jgi:hypothetical protein
VVTFSYSNTAHSDTNGIPFNPIFPKAQYPYAQAPDACSGVTDRPDSNGEIKDNWGPVDFRGACNNHDKCFYTIGSNPNTCNKNFLSDLKAACYRDLKISINVPAPTLSNPFGTRRVDGPPEPTSLTTCYSIATTYYAGVQAGVQLTSVFIDAQNKQRAYESWVAGFSRTSPNPCNSEFCWRSGGKIPGISCVQWLEPADPHTWNDNYLCSNQDYGIRWSSAGPISGMRCTQIYESADPHTWNDNYLCVPPSSPINFSWASAGPIPNKKCMQIYEPADPHTWMDNYLCY